ncbi:MAG: hypothetical protein HGA39_02430 [Coriobacteriia bacterium]|nr:hypothetical protein [Coriobacteriia bacterium]
MTIAVPNVTEHSEGRIRATRRLEGGDPAVRSNHIAVLVLTDSAHAEVGPA